MHYFVHTKLHHWQGAQVNCVSLLNQLSVKEVSIQDMEVITALTRKGMNCDMATYQYHTSVFVANIHWMSYCYIYLVEYETTWNIECQL